MAKAPVVDRKGQEIKEYPKLVRMENGPKVKVNSAEEEAALEGKAVTEKAAKKGWKDK